MSGVDRAALIEAAHQVLYGKPRCPAPCTGAAPAIVDAVLPLVAQAIEQKRSEHFAEYGNEEPRACGEDWGYTRSARLVRSLAEEGQQQ